MKIAQRCLFTGSLSCEPDFERGGGVNFELREVVEFDQAGGIEVIHPEPVRVWAKGDLGARAFDDLRLGDRVLISGEQISGGGSSGLDMEAYEILSRPSQKKMEVPKVWAVADGRPFEPTIL